MRSVMRAVFLFLLSLVTLGGALELEQQTLTQTPTTKSHSSSAPTPLDPMISYSTYVSNAVTPFGGAAASSAGEVCVVVGATLTKLRSDGSVIYSRAQTGWIGDQAAIDSQGNCYVVGRGTITPTPGAFQTAAGSQQFVMKFDGAGGIVYATFLGGSNPTGDSTSGIVIDSSGNAHLGGSTISNDFPTKHAFQSTLHGGGVNGGGDGFVAVLNAAGTDLVYSTYLGGTDNDDIRAVATDGLGNTYVVGDTFSADFPTRAALQPTLAGTRNAIVAKLDPAGTLVYSTFLGGTVAVGMGISVDSAGNAYLSGVASVGFPLVNPLQSSNANLSGFVAKLNSSGSTLLYSTYFGFNVDAVEIRVDSNGQAYLTGEIFTTPVPPTGSSLIPMVSPIQLAPGGQNDGFISVLDPTGTNLIFSSLLGGPGDEVFHIAGVDANGNMYIGATADGPFPIVNAQNGTFDPFHKTSCNPCGQQGIVFKIAPVSGAVLAFPTTVDFRPAPQPLGTSSLPASVLLANPNSATNLTISDIAVSGDFSLTGNCLGTLAAGGDCLLSATFTPTAAGTRMGTITITDTASGSPHAITLIGTTLVPGADLEPAQLSFGSQVMGTTSASQVATLTNSGGVGLAFGSISVSGDFKESNNCGSSVAPTASCQIDITFTPTAAGARTGTLTVVDNATGSPQTVALSGTGADAGLGLSVAAGTSNSATVSAGQSAPYTLSIGGSGTGGTASLSCSGAPLGATCAVHATQAVSATVPAVFNVNVTTTSRTLSAAHLESSALLASFGVLTVLAMLFWPERQRARQAAQHRFWLLLLILAFLQVSCGSGSSHSNPSTNPNGTSAGTYTLTVTAVLGSTTNTTSLTLIVQ